MHSEQRGFRVVPVPRQRKVYIDTLHVAHRKHLVHGLVEADVTEARRFLREHKAATGESLSFTAFVIACVGQAVDEHPQLHAYRNWRNQFVLFDEVDVTTMFEVELGGERSPLAHVIRAANKRTVRDIHEEIRGLQALRQRDKGRPFGRYVWLYGLVPGFLRRLVWRLLFRSPHLLKKYVGTVGLTAVGMFGQGGGWALTEPNYTLGLAVGGIAEKPGVVDGQVEIREYLSLTVGVDHDVVDGAPIARFVQRLKELLESGYGLVEGNPPSEPPPA